MHSDRSGVPVQTRCIGRVLVALRDSKSQRQSSILWRPAIERVVKLVWRLVATQKIASSSLAPLSTSS